MEERKNLRRGDVFLADLSGAGGVLKKKRPVLVVQNDLRNRHAADTIILAIRDPHGGRLLPVHVPVGKGTGGLQKDSEIDAGHVMTVPKTVLAQRIGSLPLPILEQVDRSLLISLGLAS